MAMAASFSALFAGCALYTIDKIINAVSATNTKIENIKSTIDSVKQDKGVKKITDTESLFLTNYLMFNLKYENHQPVMKSDMLNLFFTTTKNDFEHSIKKHENGCFSFETNDVMNVLFRTADGQIIEIRDHNNKPKMIKSIIYRSIKSDVLSIFGLILILHLTGMISINLMIEYYTSDNTNHLQISKLINIMYIIIMSCISYACLMQFE